MCPQLRSSFRSVFSRIVDPFLTMPVDPGNLTRPWKGACGLHGPAMMECHE